MRVKKKFYSILAVISHNLLTIKEISLTRLYELKLIKQDKNVISLIFYKKIFYKKHK